MKKIILIGFFVSVFCVFGADNKTGYEWLSVKDEQGNVYQFVKNDPTNLRIYTLKNGLKVYLSQNHLEPKIVARIAVRAGSTYDPADNTGLAHYLEHLMFKGTSKIGSLNWKQEKIVLQQISALYEQHKNIKDPEKKAEIYREIDRISNQAAQYVASNELPKLFKFLGAQGTNAYTFLEETVYVNEIPSNQLENFLFLESERFKEVVLRLFHTELEAVYEEFNMGQDNDDTKVNKALLASLFPHHPYGTQTTIGTAEHLKNPSMVAIQNYFNRYYVPNNMAIILSGDLNYEQTFIWIQKYFGDYKTKKNLTPPTFASEPDFIKPVEQTVLGSSPENVVVAFRLPSVSRKTEILSEVLNNLLTEESGIFDANLIYPQKIQKIDADVMQFRDYGVHDIQAFPKADQSLEEVKNLILIELDKVKKADFDTALLAAVTQKMKLDFYQSLKKDQNRVNYFVQSFILDKKWDQTLQEIDQIQDLKTVDFLDFVNKNYQENFAVIYKKIGTDPNVVKVKSPPITPIIIQRDQPSTFLRDFMSRPKAKAIEPVFVDYTTIQQKNLKNGLTFVYNPDESPFQKDIFSLTYLFDFGKNSDLELALAFDYADFLGTETTERNALKTELFKLGLSVDFMTNEDQAAIHLSGAKKSLEQGVIWLENFITHLKVDQLAYQNLIENTILERENAKKEPDQVLNRLIDFSIYGENSALRNFLSVQELKTIKPENLVKRIKNIFTYPHRVIYQGNEPESAQRAVEAHHQVTQPFLAAPKPKNYLEKNSENKIFTVNYDKVQAFYIFTLKDRLLDPQFFVYARLFNSYFGAGLSSIVFQEIREAKALAYRAMVLYQNAKEKEHYNTVVGFAATQTDKLMETQKTMTGLLQNLPKNLIQFEQAKQNILDQIATERIATEDLFWNLEKLKKMGLNTDIRQEIYQKTQKITWEEFETFFKETFNNKPFNQGIIGNLQQLQISDLTPENISLEKLFNE